jgi:Ribbon-helix-helix protein, copG family
VKKTSLYLDPDLDEALARRAADEGLTKAEFIRRTLAAAMQKPRRVKPSVGVFRSTDGLGVRRDWDRMMEGFGED